MFGLMFDGGFAMGANLPLFTREGEAVDTEVITSDGETVIIPERANFGTLSSGGLY